MNESNTVQTAARLSRREALQRVMALPVVAGTIGRHHMARAAEQSVRGLSRFSRSPRQKGVEFRISVYAPSEAVANSGLNAAFARIAALNSVLSDYDSTSELRRLCAAAVPGKPVAVSTDLWRVLSAAQQLALATDGRFDVTVGPLVRLWRRARRQQELPAPARLAAARKLVGHDLVRLHSTGRRVELLQPGMRLDLGGIAKGDAADQALHALAEHGLTRALVDGSGDIAAGDPPPGQPGWRIAIAALKPPAPAAGTGTAPEPAQNDTAGLIILRNAAVATSGDAYQHVEIDGVRYSHIVDPHTGLGLTTPASVTVLASDGMRADALASAVSVLGPKDGLALIDARCETAARVARFEQGAVRVVTSRRWPPSAEQLHWPPRPVGP